MKTVKIVGIIVVTLVVLSGIGVGLYFLLQPVSNARKPAIYLYNIKDEIFSESLSVHIPNGHATVTIPDIPLGDTISWTNLEIHPNSEIIYQGTSSQYLFYEAEITSQLELSDRGWCIEKSEENYVYKGQSYKLAELKNVLGSDLLGLDLFINEVTDFIDYWFEIDPLFLKDGHHYLVQLESNWIESNFQISTVNEYTTNRIFFAYIYSESSFYSNLIPPQENVKISDSNYILHEWGIII